MDTRRAFPMTRRAALRIGVVGAVPAVVGRFVVNEPPPNRSNSAGDELPFVPARRAQRLVNAFGVVVHLHFQRSVYRHVDRVVDAVVDLGARHVRTRLSHLPGAHGGFDALARQGVRVEGVCGAFGDAESMDSILGRLVRDYDDPTHVFAAFEGINEPNNKGRPWVAETRQKVQDLYAARARYGLESVRIVGPSIARVNSGGVEGGDTQGQSSALGDLSPWIDRGNIHVYPRGRPPSTDIDQFLAYQREVCGELPIRCTEGGFFTAEHYTGGAVPTPEEAVSSYLPRQLLEHWIRGVDRFFCYELLDDPDPSGADREAHFGLLAVAGPAADDLWTPKAQYVAMRNLLSILSDPGPRFGPGGLRVGLEDPGADVRSALLAKRDGSFLLCVWRDVSVYDTGTERVRSPAPQRVRVFLAEKAILRVYEPSTQSAPVRCAGPACEIDLTVGGEVVMVGIHPRTATNRPPDTVVATA